MKIFSMKKLKNHSHKTIQKVEAMVVAEKRVKLKVLPRKANVHLHQQNHQENVLENQGHLQKIM
jgi:hypothetical protein